MARILIFAGVLIVFAGVILLFFPGAFKWIGRLPGDIHVRRENFNFSFPVVTMIVISLIITIIVNILRRL